MRDRGMMVMTLAAALLLGSGVAHGQSGTCTPITSVPAATTASGVYCLTGNLTNTSIHAPAIAVNHNGVVIDFNGYRLLWEGSVSSGNPAVKIENQNVTIRNGLISDFDIGIESSGDATIVEDMRLHNNGLGIAIRQGAEGALIRHNYIRLGNGIEIYGNNSAATLGAAGTGSARVIDNDIHGPDQGGSNGIAIYGQNAFVAGNRLGRLYSGIWFDLRTQASGKYRDNLTTNVTLPYTGGTDAGNNN